MERPRFNREDDNTIWRALRGRALPSSARTGAEGACECRRIFHNFTLYGQAQLGTRWFGYVPPAGASSAPGLHPACASRLRRRLMQLNSLKLLFLAEPLQGLHRRRAGRWHAQPAEEKKKVATISEISEI